MIPTIYFFRISQNVLNEFSYAGNSFLDPFCSDLLFFLAPPKSSLSMTTMGDSKARTQMTDNPKLIIVIPQYQ